MIRFVIVLGIEGFSIDALFEVPIELRNHTSMTVAIDPKLLPEAIKRLTRFRREMSQFLESSVDPTQVYQLSLSLFPATHIAEQNVLKEAL